MSLQKIKYFLFGIIISASIVSVVTYATWDDGVFGDYFQNIINNAWICNNANSVVTSFDNSLGSSYGTKICRTIKDLVSSLGIYNVAGNIGIGTNSPNAHLTVSGSIQIKDGTEWDGKVLTSDATGKASWKTISGGGDIEIITWSQVCGMSSYDILLDSSGNPLTKNNSFCALTSIDDDTVTWLSVWEWDISLNVSWQWQYRFAAACWWANHKVRCVKFNPGSWNPWFWSLSWWENVPLTDTNDFDVQCQYRMITGNLWWATHRYSAGVSSNNLFFGYNLKTAWIWWHIWNTDKGLFDVGSGYWTFTVLKLEKNCGGGGGGYTKVCDVAYAAPSFAAPTSSHMHSLPVPDSWTSETCRWYMWQTKWWAAETHYRLGCIDSSGVSQWTYSSVNAWTADAWIPAANCGW